MCMYALIDFLGFLVFQLVHRIDDYNGPGNQRRSYGEGRKLDLEKFILPLAPEV